MFKEPVSGLTLKLPQSEGQEETVNPVGIATKHLLDLQRFLACRKVMQQEHLVQPQLAMEIKTVVATSKVTSPRINLMFRSNSLWRRDFLASFSFRSS